MAELTPLILLSCRILPGFKSNVWNECFTPSSFFVLLWLLRSMFYYPLVYIRNKSISISIHCTLFSCQFTEIKIIVRKFSPHPVIIQMCIISLWHHSLPLQTHNRLLIGVFSQTITQRINYWLRFFIILGTNSPLTLRTLQNLLFLEILQETQLKDKHFIHAIMSMWSMLLFPITTTTTTTMTAKFPFLT